MRYIISDIHGCYDEYMDLINKINLKDKDILYILGDVVDRGPKPMDVFKDIMNRKNVVYLLGNHDFLFYEMIKKFDNDLKDKDKKNLSSADIDLYFAWSESGGKITMNEFKKMSKEEKIALADYIENASLYEEIYHDNKHYILTHAGLENFDKDKEIGEYEIFDYIEGRSDYSKRYIEDENTFFISGHTPTMLINDDRKPHIYKQNGHIAIDCGCVYGGKLAAYCIETQEEFYSD